VSTGPPRTVFGLPVRNGEDHLAEALGSLIGQTRGDLAVVVVDNASSDRTGEIARECAAGEPRLLYRRNERMLGLVDNWRRAFDLAGKLFPDASYFAWASDHDLWEPGWLAALTAELESHPEAVLAYPTCIRIDDAGLERSSRERHFDTAGVAAPAERLRRAVREMPAGDMVYGLLRRDAAARCGPFPLVLLPDRLFLARLSLEGEFRQVHSSLWRRRYRRGQTFAVERQRRAFFVDDVPARAYLPWWLAHTALLFRSLRGRPGRVSLAVAYLQESLGVELRRRAERRERRRGRRRKQWRGWRRRVGGTMRRRLGRTG
jgi:glycosyltransferase involved in cell wall biosynthesis